MPPVTRPNAGDDSNPRSGEGGPRRTPAQLAADPAFTNTYAQQSKVLWGSAVAATGDSKVGTNCDPVNNIAADSWLTHLYLASNGDLDFPVNAGHGGYTSTQLAGVFAAEVIAKNPSFVVEDMGTNDSLDGSNTAAPTIASLTTILAQCRSAGIPLVITTLMPFGTAALGAPAAPTVTVQSTGGTFATASPQYRVTATNGVGETQAGTAATATISSGTTNSVLIEPPYVAGATGYKFYRSDDSGSTWGLIGSVSASGSSWLPARTFTDTNITKGASVPGGDTTANALAASTRQKALTINLAKKRFATQNGLVCLDFYAQVVDPNTGTWQTGYTRDGTHPTPQASKILGQYAWTQLKGYVRRRAPIGSLDNSDPLNYLPGTGTSVPNPNGVNSNGMLGSGSSTAPQGWGPASNPSTGASTSRGARTGHSGQAFSETRTTWGSVFSQGPWFNITTGHTYAVRFKAEFVGGDTNGSNIGVGAKWHGNSTPTNLCSVAVASDFGPVVCQAIGVAPATATQLEVAVNLAGEGTAVISEIFVYDLTSLGLT